MMSRATRVKQVDVKRALKGVAAAGWNVQKVDIDTATGKIVLTLSGGAPCNTANPWDEVLR